MSHFRFFHIVTVFCLGLFFLFLSFSAGHDIPTAVGNTSGQEQVEPLTIKLSVEEVRLDVVVLDRNGNPVIDLTAADFEVFNVCCSKVAHSACGLHSANFKSAFYFFSIVPKFSFWLVPINYMDGFTK